MYARSLVMLRRPALSLSLLLLTLPALPTAAASTSPVLDQEQSVFNGALSIRGGASQTVTVGVAGLLVRVDLVLCAPIKNADVQVTVTNSGANAGSATTSLRFRQSYADCAWYTFAFGQPIKANVGDVIILSVKTQNHKAALWGRDGRAIDSYPRGVGTWRRHAINDFAFRTYMQ